MKKTILSLFGRRTQIDNGPKHNVGFKSYEKTLRKDADRSRRR